MTLRDLIKKVNNYNEIAEIIGEEKKALALNYYSKDCSCRLWGFKTTSYSELRHEIINYFVDDYAKELITFDNYEFDRDSEFDNSIIAIRIVNA